MWIEAKMTEVWTGDDRNHRMQEAEDEIFEWNQKCSPELQLEAFLATALINPIRIFMDLFCKLWILF